MSESTKDSIFVGEIVGSAGERRRGGKVTYSIEDESGRKMRYSCHYHPRYERLSSGSTAVVVVREGKSDVALSDIYCPDEETWIGDYPRVDRDVMESFWERFKRRRRSRGWASNRPTFVQGDEDMDYSDNR